MWCKQMEPLIITKCVFNIAERGLFRASFDERNRFRDSPLIVVNDSGSCSQGRSKLSVINIAAVKMLEKKNDGDKRDHTKC